MRVLVTAFEPFGRAETNITQSVLYLLTDSISDWAIEKVCLPVSFKRAPIVLREAIATFLRRNKQPLRRIVQGLFIIIFIDYICD